MRFPRRLLACFLFTVVASASAAELPEQPLYASPEEVTKSGALEEFNPVDRFLLTRAWWGYLSTKDGGEKFSLIMNWYPHTLTSPTAARSRALDKAHNALLWEDSRYRDVVNRITEQFLATLGYRVTEREGRLFLVPLLLQNGILQRIVARAGPGPTELDAEFTTVNPWGDARPFTKGVQRADRTFSPAALMFHWCQGFTISGPLDDPYRRAHTALMSDDAYRDFFNRTVYPFSVRQVDALDPRAVVAYNRELWETLTASGVVARIEERANSARMVRAEVAKER